jgi:homopolymeric O-antigen transport system ATP-binding protein
MPAAIRVKDVSKKFRIGCDRTDARYRMLREVVTDTLAAPWRFLQRSQAPRDDGEFWALRDLTFDVRPGEAVGFLGRNGAGKSTLLKILSQITGPTKGRIELRGRVGSLLEVGTGFHLELSGRENVYMNGSILGMSRREIRSKFDEIVEFSGVERFLDTPVKRYSSGMRVRLAFAVAAHLEPDILMVDEVLAVGDAEFQKKCLTKMQEVGRTGRTVFFVSHHLGSLRSLCTRGIVLESGRITADSEIGPAIEFYLKGIESQSSCDITERTDRSGAGDVRLVRVATSDGQGGPDGILRTGQRAQFEMHVSSVATGLECVFFIFDEYGQLVTVFDSQVFSTDDVRRTGEVPCMTCEVDEILLAAGRYRIDTVIIANGRQQDWLVGARYFQVLAGDIRGRPAKQTRPNSNVSFPHRWQVPVKAGA